MEVILATDTPCSLFSIIYLIKNNTAVHLFVIFLNRNYSKYFSVCVLIYFNEFSNKCMALTIKRNFTHMPIVLLCIYMGVRILFSDHSL